MQSAPLGLISALPMSAPTVWSVLPASHQSVLVISALTSTLLVQHRVHAVELLLESMQPVFEIRIAKDTELVRERKVPNKTHRDNGNSARRGLSTKQTESKSNIPYPNSPAYPRH
jgi:hypothetical protein